MTNISNEECKSIMIDILLDIDAFCKANNLRYSLAFGTLIGAVRHGGFIPWDDDIDIMMPRPDYEVFRKKYNGHHNHYECIYCCKNDEVYCTKTFAKVHDKRTIVIEQENASNDKYGVFVDVFPIDGVPKSEFGFKLQCALYHLIESIMRVSSISFTRLSSISTKFKKLLGMCVPVSILGCINDVILSTVDYNRAKEAGVLCLENDKKKKQPKNRFEQYTTVKFEGHEFMSIYEIDANLTHYYGDYMVVPSVEQQINHCIKAYHKR